MKYIVLPLLILMHFVGMSLDYSIAQESFTMTQELGTEATPQITSKWNTVVTYNGTIYYIYVDKQANTKVGMYRNGNWTWKVVRTNTLLDATHSGPTLGVDEKGNIHTAYDMHNHKWRYSLSSKPEDINTMVQTTPAGLPRNNGDGEGGVSYAMFFQDRLGKLWLTWRAAENNNKPGVLPYNQRRNGMVARYNIDTKSWQVFGGGSFKAFSEDTDYGVYKPRLAFGPCGSDAPSDCRQRIHIIWSWKYKKATGGSVNNIAYAYSDDDGVSWNRLDGRPYGTLPIDEEETADGGFIYNYPRATQSYAIKTNEPFLGLDGQRNPLIIYTIGGGQDGRRIVRASGKKWTTPEYISGLASPIFSGQRGEMMMFNRGRTFYRSLDNGNTWKSYNYPTGESFMRLIVDERYLNDTGNFRLAAHDWDFTGRNIFTLSFTNGINGDKTPPATPTNVRVESK